MSKILLPLSSRETINMFQDTPTNQQNNEQQRDNKIWSRLKRAQTQHQLSNFDSYRPLIGKSNILLDDDKTTPRQSRIDTAGSKSRRANNANDNALGIQISQLSPNQHYKTPMIPLKQAAFPTPNKLSSLLNYQATTNRLPYEQFHIEDELKPLTARIKRSYFNIAIVDQVGIQEKLKSQLGEDFTSRYTQSGYKQNGFSTTRNRKLDNEVIPEFEVDDQQVQKQLQCLGDGQLQKFLTKKFQKLDKRTLVNKKTKRQTPSQVIDQATKMRQLQQNQTRILAKSSSQQNIFYKTRNHIISDLTQQQRLEEQKREQKDQFKSQLLIQQNEFLMEEFKKDLQIKKTQSKLDQERMNFILSKLKSNQNSDINMKKWMNQNQEHKPLGKQLEEYFKTERNPIDSQRLNLNFTNHHNELQNIIPKPKYITTLEKNSKKIKALKTPKNNYLRIKTDRQIITNHDSDYRAESSKKLRFNLKTSKLEEVDTFLQPQRKMTRHHTLNHLPLIKRDSSKRKDTDLLSQKQQSQSFDKSQTLEENEEVIDGSQAISLQLFKSKLRKGLLQKINHQIEESIKQKSSQFKRQIFASGKQEKKNVSSKSSFTTNSQGRIDSPKIKTEVKMPQSKPIELNLQDQNEKTETYNKLITNLVQYEQQATKRGQSDQAQENLIPTFMRNALKHKLEQISVNIMKDTVQTVIDKLQVKQDHFEKLNNLCQIIQKCEKVNIENKNEDKQSTTRVLMKTNFVKLLNENVESKMLNLINHKLEERNFMRLVYDINQPIAKIKQ
eukprot:403344355